MDLWKEKFDKLAPHEQQILGLFLLMDVSYETKDLLNLVRFMSFNAATFRPYQGAMERVIRQLEINGWLMSASSRSFKIHPSVEVFPILAELSKNAAHFKSVKYASFAHYQINYIHKDRFQLSQTIALLMRNVMVALLEGDQAALRQAFQQLDNRPEYQSAIQDRYGVFMKKMFESGEGNYIQYVHPKIQQYLVAHYFTESLTHLGPFDEVMEDAPSFMLDLNPAESYIAIGYYVMGAWMTGQAYKTALLKKKIQQPSLIQSIAGFEAWMEGRFDEAIVAYHQSMELYRNERTLESGQYLEIPIHYPVVFLKLYQEFYGPADTPELKLMGLTKVAPMLLHLMDLAMGLRALLEGQVLEGKNAIMKVRAASSLEELLKGFVFYWGQIDPQDELLEDLQEVWQKGKKGGYPWVSMTVESLLNAWNQAPVHWETDELSEFSLDPTAFLRLFPQMDPWERSLRVLEHISQQEAEEKAAIRVAYMLYPEGKTANLELKLQIVSRKGGWSRGRSMSMTMIRENLAMLDRQDQLILSSIEPENKTGQWASSNDFYYDPNLVFPMLIGHPLVFLGENPDIPLSLVAGTPEITFLESEEGIKIDFSDIPKHPGVHLIRETPTRYKVIRFTEEQFRLFESLGRKSIIFPATAKERLRTLIPELSKRVSIKSLMEEDIAALSQIQAKSIIHVHLLPLGSTQYQLEMLVKPLDSKEQYLKPGLGNPISIEEVDGQDVSVLRNLEEERARVQQILEAVPVLGQQPSVHLLWELEGAEACLQALTQLNPLRIDGQIVIEWPKGEKYKITGTLDFGQLSLRITRDKDYWFALDGDVQLDDHHVIKLRELLAMSAKTNNQFIEVSDGQYLALTKELQLQLNQLNGMLQADGETLRFHELAGGALEHMLRVSGHVDTDAAWGAHKARIEASLSIQPVVPSTFKAELRSYQIEGYEWLMRMANWGVGACLADDMGLGKTIQALAVLVERAEQGPALVIAPASVCRNWLRECNTFAPTLNPMLFGEGDRKAQVQDLKKGDLLIVSYGLLPFETELLSTVEFGTIILDEAQAIKNYNTQRFKASLQLNAKFRLITTGTPMENHLGELWALFEFLNPGLLGSLRQFTERFAGPIKIGDDDARFSLKNIVRPFILRRRKKEVLKDLPSKTEVVLSVPLSDDEKAFYEAIRQNALARVNNESQNGKSVGSQHLTILAEIMRLRRACCHPKLVDMQQEIMSSKMQLFQQTVEELLENGHKALVFSQFVDYLRLVEGWVKKQGIPYQYLDGSTPTKKREEAVQAFQGGEGELFLISLRAGGVGLNLTEADYVLILDPWWNPAVEDQASDRAHRIGQEKPVTVYRLITEDTIEEKIVKLHHEKRDLADSLLDGTHTTGRLSSEELLDMLKSGW